MKFSDLFEQNIGYTPEGIDKHIVELKNYIEKVQKFHDSIYNEILNKTIKDCLNDLEGLNKKAHYFGDVKKIIENKHSDYYRILESFEVGEYPDNVYTFEKLVNRLGDLLENINYINNSYDDMLSASKSLSNLY